MDLCDAMHQAQCVIHKSAVNGFSRLLTTLKSVDTCYVGQSREVLLFLETLKKSLKCQIPLKHSAR